MQGRRNKWIFEKENKSTKIIRVIHICKYISTCVLFNTDQASFDCPCGAAMWRGCNVLAIAPAKNAKQNKKKLGCN